TLPTTQELAAQFETSVFTIQTAMAPLVAEGMLERRRNLGTVVRHNPKVLTCAGIYVPGNFMDKWKYAFYLELCRELERQLGGRNVRARMFVDMRPEAEHLEPLPDLRQAVEAREIQALFVPLCGPRTVSWLRRLPGPKSFVATVPEFKPVGTDDGQMLELALSRLRERGCRSIGMISAVYPHKDPFHRYFKIYERFRDLISDLGLKTNDKWILTPAEDGLQQFERHGYDAFRRLWGMPERPDGLFVFPDTTARGVMTAALELGARVPDDLKIVFHRNSGVEWFCPLAVDWVEVDTAQWAAEMIGQIRKQVAGEEFAEVNLPFRLC
ncbi:MAG: substrate-binding domain-containing protein, partial [Lentisphaerota bacterium]